MALIPAKDFLNSMAASAAKLFDGLGRGEVVAWEDIERAAGIRRYTEHWTSFRKKLRKLLLRERGVSLWAVPGVGLKLATQDEQIHLNCVRRQRRVTRQYSMAIEEANAVPSDELSVNRRRLQAFTVQSLRRKRLEAKRGIREQSAEAKRTHTNPRRPFPPAGESQAN